jgi:hypothetical protein
MEYEFAQYGLKASLSVNMNLMLDARGGAHWRNAVWSTWGIIPLLWYSACGTPAARWFLSESEGRRHMAVQWRQAGFLHLEREAPHASGSGKILHLMAAPACRPEGPG